MEKLTKENIYINLQGKTKEELTDLWEFLNNSGEKQFRETINDFLINYYGWIAYEFTEYYWEFSNSESLRTKTEVTIEQLKQIIKPMGTFTPIAMKCTQEQFEAVKPKLTKVHIESACNFEPFPYLINYYADESNNIGNISFNAIRREFIIHEEWNEEIFLKACGIEVYTLQEQLQKAQFEVERLQSLIEEENKPKVGDYMYNTDEELFYKKTFEGFNQYERKITNPELIKLLEDECSTKN